MIIALIAASILTVAYRRKALVFNWLWLPVFGLASLYWLGWGDINHLAASSSQAAMQAEANHDWKRAITLHRLVVFQAPGLAEPKLSLANAFAQSGNMDEAISSAEAAIDSPFTSSWEERFEVLVTTANLHFQRRGAADLNRATQLYRQAELLWRHNSRLPDKTVANLLYNQSRVALLQTKPTLEAVAGLLEALALNPSLANVMLQEADLASLNLNNLPPPAYERTKQIREIRNASAPQLIRFAWQEKFDVHELAQILAELARNYQSSTIVKPAN